MIISENWVREWVEFDPDFASLGESLTAAGLECGAVTDLPALPAGVVAGHIVKCAKHPGADNLRLCSVDFGSSIPAQIVCGAANARPGAVVPLALPGTILRSGHEVQASEIRGQGSAGMLCSAADLGFEEQSVGLLEMDSDLEPGQELNLHFDLPDRVLEIDLTPNRGDCLSILGIAREVAAVTAGKLLPPKRRRIRSVTGKSVRVRLDAPSDCPRYMGRFIDGVQTGARSPDWIRERLRRSGIRSVDVLVDISNYVMLELGQPMHAFDGDRLNGAITVRFASKGERLKLLDGAQIRLQPHSLVITDESGPVALAGVKGGAGTMITPATKVVMLEAAFFNPGTVARTARHYQMNTDASHRFERGVDFSLPAVALHRASQLITEICGGNCGPLFGKSDNRLLPNRKPLVLRRHRLDRMLGAKVRAKQVREVFTAMGIEIKRQGDRWLIAPPTYRFDLAGEHDLIEEVARLVGYDQFTPRRPRAVAGRALAPEGTLALDRARDQLVDRGYCEVVTYSFVDPDLQVLVSPGTPAINLRNPIATQFAQMRLTLLPGLIGALANNARRQVRDAALFETGHVFLRKGRARHEEQRIGGVIMGTPADQCWSETRRTVDFFDIKGDVQTLLHRGRGAPGATFVPDTHPAYQAGQTARIVIADRPAGWVGRLSMELQQYMDLDQPVFAFELKWDEIFRLQIPRYSAVSRFPAINRDLSFVIDEQVSVDQVKGCIRDSGGDLLTALELIDLYRGPGVGKEKKSVTYRLTLQSIYRNLTDKEADEITGRVVGTVEDILAGMLRTT